MHNEGMHTAHQLRALSVAAQCDPRTATRFLAGLPVAPMTAARLEAAAAQLGILRAQTMAIASGDPLVAEALGGRTVA
jgi:hypothetical protein